MDTIYVKIPEGRNIRESVAVRRAADVVRAGGLAAIPTETVYGLAADALNPEAVAKIFVAKGRPQDNPLIVHIADFADLPRVAREIPPAASALAEKFWPGPLTIIMKKTPAVPDVTSAGLDTVGVRMPSHPAAREIIRACGVPLAAPSANISGRPSATTAEHCRRDFDGLIDIIADGGSCRYGVESTVISLAGEKPTILRPGAVTFEQIKEILPDVEISDAVLRPLGEGEKILSPGLKYRHYAPAAQVVLVSGSFAGFARVFAQEPAGEAFAVVFDGEKSRLGTQNCAEYGGVHNPAAQAERLFAVLRETDAAGVKKVYVRCPDKTGVALAVYNRLLRAAGFAEVTTE